MLPQRIDRGKRVTDRVKIINASKLMVTIDGVELNRGESTHSWRRA